MFVPITEFYGECDQAITLSGCIQKVPNSSFGMDTDNPD